MDDEQLREDVRAGRVDADRLVDLIGALQRELRAAQERIAELERQQGGQSPTPRLDQPYSLHGEEYWQQKRGKQARRRKRPARKGRITTAEQVAQAERSERVFPNDVPECECRSSHTRVMWRLERSRAVRVAYEVDRGPANRYGVIPGVLGKAAPRLTRN